MIAIRTKGMLSLAFDHRIVDGADADRFMADVKAGCRSSPRAGPDMPRRIIEAERRAVGGQCQRQGHSISQGRVRPDFHPRGGTGPGAAGDQILAARRQEQGAVAGAAERSRSCVTCWRTPNLPGPPPKWGTGADRQTPSTCRGNDRPARALDRIRRERRARRCSEAGRGRRPPGHRPHRPRYLGGRAQRSPRASASCASDRRV